MLQQYGGKLATRMGACYPGSHAVFRGHDLHRELNEAEWIDLYVFGITGRRLTPQQIRLLNAIWVHTSYPDARLWNNRVAALAASARSSANLGITAALAVSEATVYGGRAGMRAMSFLQRARRAVSEGADLHELVRTEAREKRIYGYGRPIHATDERIPPLLTIARRLELDRGQHLKLAFEVERILVPHYPQLRINFAAVHAALIADMGFSVREYQMLRIPTFLAGMPPCTVEAGQGPAGALFPTRCDDIAYEGVGIRAWHR